MNEIQQLFNLKRNEDGTVAVSGRIAQRIRNRNSI